MITDLDTARVQGIAQPHKIGDTGDVNGDGFDDIYLWGTTEPPSVLSAPGR